MWNMDETDLVSYYRNKVEEWIFQPKLGNVLIEDDEILDLDSLDLGSNEDTWYVTPPPLPRMGCCPESP